MAAIITEQFRKVSANRLLEDLRETNYYVGIGQQKPWPEAEEDEAPPFPQGTYGDNHRVIENLTGMFRVNDFDTSIMIPAVELDGNVEYKVYDPFDPTCFYSDIINNVQPCYVTINKSRATNAILLCIGKNLDAAGMNTSTIETQLLLSSLNDFEGPVFIDGYLWVYIGRYTKYSDLNTKEFVAISDETTLSTETHSSYAYEIFSPIGNNNDILITALDPGDGGNSINVRILEDTDPGASQIRYEEIDNNTVEIYFIDGQSTAFDVVNVINSDSSIIRAELSGDGSGVMNSVSARNLIGGGTSDNLIKEATGGLVYGFSVINGGMGYHRTIDSADPGYSSAENVDAQLFGVDEYDNSKTENISVTITYDRISTEIINIKFNDGDVPTLKKWKHASIRLTSWTLANGYSDIQIPAKILCHIAPQEGFGKNKFNTLPSWYVGVYANTDASTYIATGTGYHQVSLIRDPKQKNGDDATGKYIQPLSYFTLGVQGDGHVSDNRLRPGWKIVQDGVKNIGSLSHIQRFEDSDRNEPLDPIRYYYYPNPFDGYDPLTTTGPITFFDPDDISPVATTLPPREVVHSTGYLHNSGEIVFQDNRNVIIRGEGQNEELKLVIQL